MASTLLPTEKRRPGSLFSLSELQGREPSLLRLFHAFILSQTVSTGRVGKEHREVGNYLVSLSWLESYPRSALGTNLPWLVIYIDSKGKQSSSLSF